jgi:putative membrane protein
MGSDNLDIWKKVVFNIPPTRKILSAIVFLGFIYSLLVYLGLKAFTRISVNGSIILFIAGFVFILPTITSAELLHKFIPEYPRKWGYFLAFCNQTILFAYSIILTGADNFLNAWNILWLAIITVYLSNFLVLMLTIGYNYIKSISILSIIQPALILSAFHLSLGRELEIPFTTYITNLAVLAFAGFLLLMAFLVTDFLMKANVRNVSIFQLSSGLLQKKTETLDLGYPTKPDVQTLKLENRTGNIEIAIPWVHPGPLEGFGGGRISTKIIDSLNQEGKGFFLHVPSTHKSDPVNPLDYEKILDAMKEPETSSNASKLIKKDYGIVKFYGRKIDGKKTVFMEISEENDYDDYELSVFREIIDPEETILVDLHNHERELLGDRKEVWYNTETADELRKHLLDFLDELEKQEKYDYKAGFEVDPENTKIFSLIEEVDGQKTLMFGIEGNEAGNEIKQLEKEYREEFDEVISFTTDTHRSIHDLSRNKQVETERVRINVEKSRENISSAKIGFSNNKAKSMKLLQEDYSSLIFSINILVRLIPLTLILLYFALILWLF